MERGRSADEEEHAPDDAHGSEGEVFESLKDGDI
jgi:hypothetical protein